jgi:RHS repeat-associated protein
MILLISSISAYELEFYHSDHLGSPVIVTDESQVVKWSSDYDVFGETVNEEGDGDLKYNQKEKDDTGLLYYGARYYNADTGRFITADTFKGNLVDLQSQNLYVYVQNNPMKYIDPTGNQKELSNPFVEKDVGHTIVVKAMDFSDYQANIPGFDLDDFSAFSKAYASFSAVMNGNSELVGMLQDSVYKSQVSGFEGIEVFGVSDNAEDYLSFPATDSKTTWMNKPFASIPGMISELIEVIDNTDISSKEILNVVIVLHGAPEGVMIDSKMGSMYSEDYYKELLRLKRHLPKGSNLFIDSCYGGGMCDYGESLSKKLKSNVFIPAINNVVVRPFTVDQNTLGGTIPLTLTTQSYGKPDLNAENYKTHVFAR